MHKVDRKPEDLPKLATVTRNADLKIMQDKIRDLPKNTSVSCSTAANLGRPNLASKCIKTH